MDKHLSDMLLAKNVPMGGVFEMMNAAMKGHKQFLGGQQAAKTRAMQLARGR
jgi:hypothetical protein